MNDYGKTFLELSDDDFRVEKLEFDGTKVPAVWVRELPSPELHKILAEYDAAKAKSKAAGDGDTPAEMREEDKKKSDAFFVVKGAYDEQGNRMFADSDLDTVLNRVPKRVCHEIATRFLTLNALTKSAQAALAKNSNATAGGDSGST